MSVTSDQDDTLKLRTPWSTLQTQPTVPTIQSRIDHYFLTLQEHCLRVRELFGYVAIFLLMYSACYVIPYAFYDDYDNLYQADTVGSAVDMATPVRNGRVIEGYLYRLTFAIVHNLDQLRFVRLIAVIGIGLCAWLTFVLLRRAGMRYWPAFCIPIAVFALPGYQVFVAWSISAFHSYGVLLSGAALLVTERALSTPFTRRFWALISLAVLMELASMMIYQPGAMMYLFFAAIVIFVGQLDVVPSLQRLGVYLGVTFLAIGVDDVSLHSLPGLILGQSSDSRTQLVHDIPGKIEWFLKQPLRNALNFYSLSSAAGSRRARRAIHPGRIATLFHWHRLIPAGQARYCVVSASYQLCAESRHCHEFRGLSLYGSDGIAAGALPCASHYWICRLA